MKRKEIMPKIDFHINYGVIICDMGEVDEEGYSKVLHFVGFEEEPDNLEMYDVLEEFIEEYPDYGEEELEAFLAPENIVEHYRDEYIKSIIALN